MRNVKKITAMQVLKVGANTDLSDIKACTYEHLKSGERVCLDAIGAEATYIALRAYIFTQRQMPENVEIKLHAGMVLVSTPAGDRKAVRLTLEI